MSTPTETRPRHLTPQCTVGRMDPGWPHGCPACQAPGYEHPVLGWVPVECDCEHHAEGATS